MDKIATNTEMLKASKALTDSELEQAVDNMTNSLKYFADRDNYLSLSEWIGNKLYRDYQHRYLEIFTVELMCRQETRLAAASAA